RRVPEWIGIAPEMPLLLHQALVQVAAGRMELVAPVADQKRLDTRARLDRQATTWRSLGATLLLVAAWSWTSAADLARWHEIPIIALASLGVGVVAFFLALRR
ncbi:MAG: hypothetical protein ABIR16_01725, partial [Dokdonella sp.]